MYTNFSTVKRFLIWFCYCNWIRRASPMIYIFTYTHDMVGSGEKQGMKGVFTFFIYYI